MIVESSGLITSSKTKEPESKVRFRDNVLLIS